MKRLFLFIVSLLGVSLLGKIEIINNQLIPLKEDESTYDDLYEFLTQAPNIQKIELLQKYHELTTKNFHNHNRGAWSGYGEKEIGNNGLFRYFNLQILPDGDLYALPYHRTENASPGFSKKAGNVSCPNFYMKCQQEGLYRFIPIPSEHLLGMLNPNIYLNVCIFEFYNGQNTAACYSQLFLQKTGESEEEYTTRMLDYIACDLYMHCWLQLNPKYVRPDNKSRMEFFENELGGCQSIYQAHRQWFEATQYNWLEGISPELTKLYDPKDKTKLIHAFNDPQYKLEQFPLMTAEQAMKLNERLLHFWPEIKVELIKQNGPMRKFDPLKGCKIENGILVELPELGESIWEYELSKTKEEVFSEDLEANEHDGEFNLEETEQESNSKIDLHKLGEEKSPDVLLQTPSLMIQKSDQMDPISKNPKRKESQTQINTSQSNPTQPFQNKWNLLYIAIGIVILLILFHNFNNHTKDIHSQGNLTVNID